MVSVADAPMLDVAAIVRSAAPAPSAAVAALAEIPAMPSSMHTESKIEMILLVFMIYVTPKFNFVINYDNLFKHILANYITFIIPL